jgi:penicillin-binding protein activator
MLLVKLAVFSLLVGLSFMNTACGPKAFIKGQYDNPDKENLLTDQWSETDMQKVVKEMVASLVSHPKIEQAKTTPILMVTRLQNKTSEHIETQSIMDMIRVELTQSGKVGFVDKEAREDVDAEYEYQANRVNSNKSVSGQQVGADYILNGRMDSIVQEAGKDKTVYYKITLNMTDLKTNLVVWTNQKQLRKVYKKKSIGL